MLIPADWAYRVRVQTTGICSILWYSNWKFKRWVASQINYDHDLTCWVTYLLGDYDLHLLDDRDPTYLSENVTRVDNFLTAMSHVLLQCLCIIYVTASRLQENYSKLCPMAVFWVAGWQLCIIVKLLCFFIVCFLTTGDCLTFYLYLFDCITRCYKLTQQSVEKFQLYT